jgi:hypothetical protein
MLNIVAEHYNLQDLKKLKLIKNVYAFLWLDVNDKLTFLCTLKLI